jgi:hypothetical protein
MPEFKACAVAIDRYGGPDDPVRLTTKPTSTDTKGT